MQIKNNYTTEWKIIRDGLEVESGEGVFNGDFGFITDIDNEDQGAEFPVIVMPINWGPPMLLTRNLLYTAITRAKSLVVLVGDEKYLNMMINNNRITKRYSALDKKIRNYLSIFMG